MVDRSPQPRDMTLEDLDAIAVLHRSCFPGTISIFTTLDDDLLKRYYALVIEEPESFATVLEDPISGDLVGLAIGTMKPGLQRRFVQHHFLRFFGGIFRAILVNPLVRKAVRERFKYIKRFLRGKRKSELADLGPVPDGPEAFFTLVGMHTRWRGGGNAERLVEYFTTQVFNAGVVRIRGAVGPDNLASLIMHKRLGWHAQKISDDEIAVWIDQSDYKPQFLP